MMADWQVYVRRQSKFELVPKLLSVGDVTYLSEEPHEFSNTTPLIKGEAGEILRCPEHSGLCWTCARNGHQRE